VPESIAVAVQFHYAKHYDTGQLFELVTALESLHEKRHEEMSFIAKAKFKEIKRSLREQWKDDADALCLFEKRLQNYPLLRTRLDELTVPLEHRNIVTAEQRDAFIDNLVKARNGFGHRLAAPQGNREFFRLVNQTHIVLKALLLNELGVLDLATDGIRRQWLDWQRW